MQTKQYKAGDYIHHAGEVAETLELVVKGSATINIGSITAKLDRGSVLGILETAGSPYSYDYIATEDTIVSVYPFTRFSDIEQIVEDSSSTADVLVSAFARTVIGIASKYRKSLKSCIRTHQVLTKSYEKYKEICAMRHFEVQSFQFLDEVSVFVPAKDMPDWVSDYYDQLDIMPRDAKKAYFGTHTSLVTAALWEAASHAQLYLSLCEQIDTYTTDSLARFFESPSGDLVDLYINLYQKAKAANATKDVFIEIDMAVTELFDEFENASFVPKDKLSTKMALYKETSRKDETAEVDTNEYELINNSLDTILKYASLDEAEEDRIITLISKYKATKDKNSSDEDVRQLRSEISKSFLDIYEAAICSAFESSNVPTVLKMFFCFGYMDEGLIGRDNALKLYKMTESLEEDSTGTVFTAYQWLRSIYTGANEPSKNEFDQDYLTYLKEQKAGGYISADMEQRYLTSNKEKLRFELRNFFKSGLKISSGRPSTFCPVLSDHNIIKPLENMLVTVKKVHTNWGLIKSIDYSVFFRECSYQAPEYKISRESIMLEVMPYVILMPGIGSRASLWQETSGVRRDTAGRISIPIFANEDLLTMQIKLAGEFRWEMCKKIQGARWNDVTDHSLTSEYFDYLQFYRKNNELSADAKEKIKNAISSAKNSFKNVFVGDYILWIRYESQGSPRLNKIAKAIMFTYCPFSKVCRDKIRTNPMYADMITRHEMKMSKKGSTLSAHYNKIGATNDKGLPKEIKDYIAYFTY